MQNVPIFCRTNIEDSFESREKSLNDRNVGGGELLPVESTVCLSSTIDARQIHLLIERDAPFEKEWAEARFCFSFQLKKRAEVILLTRILRNIDEARNTASPKISLSYRSRIHAG